MSKYKFICEHKPLHSDDVETRVTVETDRDSIAALMEDFQAFLLAVGFHPGLVKRYFEGENEEN